MNICARRSFLFTILLALLSASLRAADAPPNPEIEYLLHYVESAPVRFIRSDTEYSPKDAVEHLRSKLGKAGARVKTAEDFISGIASKSYLTNEAYRIKLADGKVIDAGPWLTQALAQHRQAAKAKH